MRYRQVHLDFHTSPHIDGIGSAFDKRQFQAMLRLGHVDSITLFAKCHHGWFYYDSKVSKRHPHLSFDLLDQQIEACKEIDVRTPIYISAGLDDHLLHTNPGWGRRNADGTTPWAGPQLNAGFRELCMNTPYLDELIKQVEEVMQRYNGGDGIFLDIVGPRTCYCQTCINQVVKDGKDPRDEAYMQVKAREIYLNYTTRVAQAVAKYRKDCPIFHNSGHIARGDRELAHVNPKHLELESLPTGGWGYDHFPLSAAYARILGLPFLGMTGKFHGTWGEFGGYKHPNALRLEAGRSLASGARLSVGDQLHPTGRMDPATYRIIGAAYAEVARKEAWVVDAAHVVDVALLSAQACGSVAGKDESDAGAVRMLLEGQILFDVVDADADLAGYRVIVLPDQIRVDAKLQAKLAAVVARGGKLLATGTSGLWKDRDELAFDFGCADRGPCGFDPDYIVPGTPVEPWGDAAFVVHGNHRKLELRGGKALAKRDEPWFNRDIRHYCSHQHAPNSGRDGGPAIVEGPAGILCAHAFFVVYHDRGMLPHREILLQALRRLIGTPTVTTTLPSQGLVTYTRQAAQRRDVLHLCYGAPIRRGKNTEVIEELVPIRDVQVVVKRAAKPSVVELAPEGTAVPFTYADGRVRFTVPVVECHQMVALKD
ncbi:MAG: beta-galactosidase trimerization domain-containing protein [Planctomycetes bacterium]|nr:beta-galactosidase trimerization domain-containing protein [Planctomycetota bacterium]